MTARAVGRSRRLGLWRVRVLCLLLHKTMHVYVYVKELMQVRSVPRPRSPPRGPTTLVIASFLGHAENILAESV